MYSERQVINQKEKPAHLHVGVKLLFSQSQSGENLQAARGNASFVGGSCIQNTLVKKHISLEI